MIYPTLFGPPEVDTDTDASKHAYLTSLHSSRTRSRSGRRTEAIWGLYRINVGCCRAVPQCRRRRRRRRRWDVFGVKNRYFITSVEVDGGRVSDG